MIAAIVGAGSMLGRALARQLRADDVQVLRVGRGGGWDIELDLGRSMAADAGRGLRADVLFHCAAAFAGDDAAGLRENLATNVLGCADVLELSDRLECRHVVHAGSVFSESGVDSGGMSSYGLTKAQAEQLLAWGMEKRGGRACSVRLVQLYDTAGECRRHQPWFARIVAYASRGLDLRLPRAAVARNFLHVDDAARLLAAAAAARLGGTWNACHPESLTMQQVAELAYAQFGQGGCVGIDDAKPPMRAMAFPDGAPLLERLGIAPPIPLAEGLARIHRAGTAADFGPLDVQ